MTNADYIKSLDSSAFATNGIFYGKRIIIAGGGTGGHIFPAIAIANEIRIQHPDTKILFVGANGKMEMEKVPAAGYDITGLDIAGYNRSSLLKNITLPFKLIKSFMQVRSILSAFKPDAVIGVGGYSSFPVLRWAQTRGIATFIHESNSLAGKSNIMLGKRAKKIFVAGYGMEKYFPADKLLMTGNPIRTELAEIKISRIEGLNFFGLKDQKTVLVVGGSLGAKSINEAILKNIDVFKKKNIQLIWQTGKSFAPDAARMEEDKTHIWTNSFINNMEYAYAAADVVVSRAGAMAVSELCAVGKAVIFVPYPHAAEDHQTANASSLVAKRAAVLIADSEVDEKLVDTILQLINDETMANDLGRNIKQLSSVNADKIIVSEIFGSI